MIALESIGRLDILERLYSAITIPDAVAVEVGFLPPGWMEVRQLTDSAQADLFRQNLGAGEAEAIALSIELSAARLILDDRKARQIARGLKQPVTGTLAIVLRAKEQGIVSNVREVLDLLLAVNFRVSDALVSEILRRAGE